MGAEALLGSLAGGASAANPVGLAALAAQIGGGALQAIIGGGKARKAQKELENMRSPMYGGNKGINDYYTEALGRYQASPYQTAQYNQMMRGAERSASNAIQALQSRRGALAGIGAISSGLTDASNNAIAAAENERNRRFGQLGSATEAKAADEMKKFQINEIAPFERNFQLKAMKAAANNQVMNTGLSNVFNGLTNYAMLSGGGQKDKSLVGSSGSSPSYFNPISTYSQYKSLGKYGLGGGN